MMMYGGTDTDISFQIELKKAIKFAGITQNDLARQVGLTPSILSLKLSESRNYKLTVPEIKLIIRVLTEKYGLNRREEVIRLLRLAGVRASVFQDDDWGQYPFNQLE